MNDQEPSVTLEWAEQLRKVSASLKGSELPTLVAILPILNTIDDTKGAPKALYTQVDRLRKLVESAIMGESPMESALRKIKEACSKMAKAMDGIKFVEPVEEPKISATSAAPAVESGDDDEERELLVRFLANQRLQLEDFESYVLEMEKGHPQANETIRRYLHTLKGEFGVLDLAEYAALVHDVEDSFLAGRLATEGLFQLKDLLNEIFGQLSVGMRLPVSAGMRQSLGLSSVDSMDAEKDVSIDQRSTTLTTDVALDQETIARMMGEDLVAGADEVSHTPATRLSFSADPSFLADFITESREHIHNIETSLLSLETDATNEEHLNSVFRACHTIKGLAGFLELGDIQRFAHAFENLMERARKKNLVLLPAHVDILLASTDCLKEMVNGVESSMRGEECPCPENLNELLDRLAHPERVSVGVNNPAQAEKKLGQILLETGVASQDKIRVALDKQKDGDTRKLGEILVEDEGAPARGVGQALGSQIQARQMQSVEESVRVPVLRLDQLIDIIGEAVIAQSMIVADPVIHDIRSEITSEDRNTLRRKVARAELIMRQIQEMSMGLRMVSVKAVFQKMARLVRDLSKKMEKSIDFVVEGESTELDKSVVENIGDPLIHMVRNSVDHGIETAEERRFVGKNPVAKVTLRAYHKAGNVYIEIEDDGRGLDREAILRKAISQGLCTAEGKYTDAEIYALIFKPGFSTAKVVTDVSGRGVGMDVVRKNIEALRGNIDIQSVAGKGTKFTIRLPLTLAIISGMVVRVGTAKYIIPTLSILETLRPGEQQCESMLGRGEVIRLRQDLIRVVRLGQVLAGDQVLPPLQQGTVVIVEDSVGHKFGMFVDEILDQQQVVVKKIGDGIARVPGVSGGAIMNDGLVSLILDVGGVIKMADETVSVSH